MENACDAAPIAIATTASEAATHESQMRNGSVRARTGSVTGVSLAVPTVRTVPVGAGASIRTVPVGAEASIRTVPEGRGWAGTTVIHGVRDAMRAT